MQSSLRFIPRIRSAKSLSLPAISTSLPSVRHSFCGTSSAQRKDPNMPSSPPKHQMVYLPQLTSAVREFGEFRKVLHTGLYSQLVAMEVPVGGDIGDEVHTVDQILLFTRGKCLATVSGKQQQVRESDVVIVPAGSQHQFENVGSEPLELITVYSPAEHDSTTVHKTKEEGVKEEEEGKDEPPDWSQKSKAENEKAGIVRTSGGAYERG